MANGSTYAFSAAFARLTGILEDATASATEGQSRKADQIRRHRLVTDLEKRIDQAALVFKEIKTTLV